MDMSVQILTLFERVFPKCREIDIKLNPEKVHILVDQLICNGVVISKDIDEVVKNYNEMTQKKSASVIPAGVSQGLGKLWQASTSYFKK